MAEILLMKTPQGALVPAFEDEAQKLLRFKVGATIRCEISQIRNYQFHKKWFSLVTLAFGVWTETAPQIEYKGVQVEPNFEKFRKDITVLCGYFTPVFNVRGEVRLEAKSISFASMEQQEFEQLYSKTIDVILKKILPEGRYTEAQLRNAVDQVMAYT